MNQVRRSKEAVPTQTILVMRGLVVGVLGIVACPTACLGIDVASVLLLQPQSRANFGSEDLDILIASGIGVLLLVLMGIGSVRTIRHALLRRELEAQGVTTQGHVVDRWRAWFSLRVPYRAWRYIAYEYADGHTAKQLIPIGIYEHTQIGTPVTVCYLADDPSISQVELVDDKKVP
jgi:hypothetical protein